MYKMSHWLFTIYSKNPSGFKLCKWNAKISIGKSRSEHALSISRKIGKNRKYIVKGLELDGKPEKCEWNEINRLKSPNRLKRTTFSSKPVVLVIFRLGRPKICVPFIFSIRNYRNLYVNGKQPLSLGKSLKCLYSFHVS